MTNRLFWGLFSFLLVLGYATSASAQEEHREEDSLQLSVPLLEGMPAPFSGVLISEDAVTQAIEDAAAVSRLTTEVAARTQELVVSSQLRDEFIAEQRTRIEELSSRSWWDDNGNVFMLCLGLILGVAASALVAGLAIN